MTTGRPGRPLLTAKRVIPPARPGAVPRERLTQLLRAAETRLTVVVAPAGWGKTSLLTGWARDPAETRRIAWVSLDAGDDEPARFWAYVLTALREAGDAVSAEPLDALGAGEVPAVDLALPILLNELAAATTRQVLVLDDYHVLTDPRIHEAVEFLVSYLPPALRLVIAGRSDPPLPLARLRVRGDLTELRAAQLEFSTGEAAALVSAVSGVALDAPAVDALWQRTEGWAAGLQLAALALRADPSRVRGDDRHLVDYFAAEVLPGLAPEQRDLLVRSAPLDLLSGPLCDAALRVSGSARVLADLVRADLFVAALDEDRHWYRCHSLLRDALLHRPGTDPREVHERAAGWFAGQGRIDDAADHLLRAGLPAAAAALLREHADSWFFARGAQAVYLRLGEQIPVELVDAPFAWSLAYAATICGDRPRTVRWLDFSESHATADTTMPGWHSFRAAVLSLRAYFGLTEADSARSLALAREAFALETAGGRPGHPNVRQTLATTLARDGRFADAAELFLELWPRRRDSWPPWLVIQVAGSMSISLMEAGRSDECDRMLRAVAPLAAGFDQDRRLARTPGLGALRIAEGRRCHHNAEFGAAAALLRHAIALVELQPRPTLQIVGLVYLADAELACGDRVAAVAALARAREVVADEPVSPFAAARLAEAERRIGRGSTRAAVRAGALAEELTDRELSILRALQGTATQREIGAALFLSVNTVKAYSKSLYRKLGVASRPDAVAAARGLGLI
ncbi:helix-turn-helix transcriptional regulator [Virgisporangium aliadipatigenens]|uniref:Helix-turn-helix transcriptional regulator n=1 Tax=Virgisporangium aliadipatigenens TaxID=741659 RepID=A0A8J4DUZ0_9ACTN|nr:LuxR family transcriptional regulator [Virgisporangium aliadipatigenens]GIJ49632.1 helix-turn-helix transcriptional regulator [Virgisporangium aliadipatigenens]